MPRGTKLTESEKGEITAYCNCGMSLRQIASKINRSLTLVHNYIKLGNKYGSNARPGPVPKITQRDKRNIISCATTKKMSASNIKAHLQLSITTRRIQQILSGSKAVKWTKRKPKPLLKQHHKNARLKFAHNHMSWTTEWRNVIFSDEKKFNLDGPDGYQYYWHDLRKERETMYSRNFGGGTVMVWAAIGYCGASPICFISTKMNAAKYTELLEEVLLEYGDHYESENWFFQHDNAAVHTARLTKDWFTSKNINILDWPAISPDLNPIENVWGLLARKVYENGHQFSSSSELKRKIQQAWSQISTSTLQTLINSMPDRLFEVIKNNGGNTHY